MRINLTLLDQSMTIQEATAIAQAIYVASNCKLTASLSRVVYPDKEHIIMTLERTKVK